MLHLVESPDERATNRLIAERTLAVEGDAAEARPGRAGRWILLVLGLILVGGAGLWLAVPSHPGEAGRAAPEDPVGAAGPAVVGQATLNVNAWPVATVYVNGRRLSQSTPLTGLHLPAGTHTISLVSKDGALRKEVSVTLQSGETRTIAVSLER